MDGVLPPVGVGSVLASLATSPLATINPPTPKSMIEVPKLALLWNLSGKTAGKSTANMQMTVTIKTSERYSEMERRNKVSSITSIDDLDASDGLDEDEDEGTFEDRNLRKDFVIVLLLLFPVVVVTASRRSMTTRKPRAARMIVNNKESGRSPKNVNASNAVNKMNRNSKKTRTLKIGRESEHQHSTSFLIT